MLDLIVADLVRVQEGDDPVAYLECDALTLDFLKWETEKCLQIGVRKVRKTLARLRKVRWVCKRFCCPKISFKSQVLPRFR